LGPACQSVGLRRRSRGAEAAAEKVCREIQTTGSYIVKRECLTPKQWVIRDEEDRARNAGLYDNARQDGNPATM